MKVTIEFTKKEKKTIMEISECFDDTNEIVKGEFGSIVYTRENNNIEMNFKEEFIETIAGLFKSSLNGIKSFMSLFNMVKLIWFNDTKVIKESEEKEEEK